MRGGGGIWLPRWFFERRRKHSEALPRSAQWGARFEGAREVLQFYKLRFWVRKNRLPGRRRRRCVNGAPRDPRAGGLGIYGHVCQGRMIFGAKTQVDGGEMQRARRECFNDRAGFREFAFRALAGGLLTKLKESS